MLEVNSLIPFEGGPIHVGQRVFSALYGGRYGIVEGIDGEQSPGTCRGIQKGCGVIGGSAHVTIIWDDGSRSPMLPEALLHSSVQWELYGNVETQETVAKMRQHANEYADASERKRVYDAEKFAMATEALKKEYPWLLNADLEANTVTRASKNIRAMLKQAFPTVKFSVKKSSHSTVDISWTDGPITSQVEQYTRQFEAGRFNGMEDIYDYKRTPWNTQFGAIDMIMVHRNTSSEVIQKAIDTLWEILPYNLKSVERPTPDNVWSSYQLIPNMGKDMVSEAVRALSSHYDETNSRFVLNDSLYGRFYVELAVKAQEGNKVLPPHEMAS
ncbi:conserved protein of unknown function [Acidithiobacillus ferrivorans]|uniref:Large polyvalent protein associated domain-containing protein n=2 Tax=Acidithiobacillus ferrivorans TaxID=160808 RepID=A0A060UPX2_9PROT|nr:LPD29 domain-containing protein [Acidithiobacillus ferrivorans]CDQ10667.1 conserved hypothetical protein [Acidithiobacillus ferrivorans]SMH64694.1 conserved protein of unknown function [Acidithiobacillus ferrivorans]